MTKFLCYIQMVALLVAAATYAHAQKPGQLPIDPNVSVKKLTNGLTYYIRANKKPENRAQFHLVINAGSILETEKQQGLAHFLEHMAFNGTKNFAKHELINFLERIGMQFGADLNAYTSFDETVYRLEIPMDDPEVLKKAFQVLEDWAHQISFEVEEIEKERGVVIEEWRTRRGAQGRLQDKQIPVLFHDSLYAQRLPIGKVDHIRSVGQAAFLEFYRKWYRPDLMAVVAVGDFDTNKVEELIVKHFGHLKNPSDSPPRLQPAVPDHEGTLFSIDTDPELSSTAVDITCKHPMSPQGTAADYRRDVVDSLYSGIMNRRLGERIQEANPPYMFARVGKSPLVRVKELASQRAVVKEGLFAEGLKALLLESRRARRDGFTSTELDRAKADMLRRMERANEERDKTESSDYAQEYVRNFLEDEPIPGVPEELRLTRRFLQEISLEEVNRAADQWITETNRVILFSAPDKPGLKRPTKEEIIETIKSAGDAEIAAYHDDVSDAPLVATNPVPGKVVSEIEHADVGAAEWVLSNGIHVLLKPTTFNNDQILMQAFSPGGHSLVPDKDYMSASMAAGIIRQSGIGAYDLIQLRKKLSGKLASVGVSIDELSEELQGSASPRDLETWFQLMHLHFTAPRADDKTFQSLLTRLKVGIMNRDRNPPAVFGDAIEKALYGDHPRHRPMSLELLGELDREAALRIYRERFANASDFTFVFVGAFKPGDLRPLVETYLASLPKLDRKERGRDVGDDPKRGQLNVEVKKGIEPKSSVRIMFYGDAPWTMPERYALRSAVDVLRIRLRELLREDKGGVYGVSVYGDLTREPKETFSAGISFTCNPDNVTDLTQAALEEIKRLQTDGPAPENLDKIRETHLRNYEKGLKEDSFWLGNLVFCRENELPFAGILKLPERVKSLTADKVRDAARKYFSSENVLIARLMPESAPASETTRPATASPPAGYSIPLIDLTADKARQVVVDREPGQYLGHPTTVLLEDGKTILCVYPKGHGKGALVYKRSTDAGLTWSERLLVPASWATSKETPSIHRVIDAKGQKRLILWSGLYPARFSVSEDDGQTWSELQPAGDWGGIVVMGFTEPIRTGPGHYLAMFHDDGRFFQAKPNQKTPAIMTLFKTISTDGGLKWSVPEEIFKSSEVHLCEPGFIRAPDGAQIAVLLRENKRVKNSHVIFSTDEGKSWTAPRELPGALTGDRHTGKYGPDGRLFISFRDTTVQSPTQGDWVAWVGRYNDIVTGSEGQYRVRLMDNTHKWDCAYPGVEVSTDGTFVTTTYGHWTTNQMPYIVSVRLKLDELDAKAARPQ